MRKRTVPSGTKQIEGLTEKLKLVPSERDALSKLVTDVRASWPDAKFDKFVKCLFTAEDAEGAEKIIKNFNVLPLRSLRSRR